jgi:hypothetical protein
MIVAGAAHDLAALFAFFGGLLVGAVGALALVIVMLFILAIVGPRANDQRQAARELNQALADYFGAREFDESDALLVRLRAAAHAHYEALIEADHVDKPVSGEAPPVATNPVGAAS